MGDLLGDEVVGESEGAKDGASVSPNKGGRLKGG